MWVSGSSLPGLLHCTMNCDHHHHYAYHHHHRKCHHHHHVILHFRVCLISTIILDINLITITAIITIFSALTTSILTTTLLILTIQSMCKRTSSRWRWDLTLHLQTTIFSTDQPPSNVQFCTLHTVMYVLKCHFIHVYIFPLL